MGMATVINKTDNIADNITQLADKITRLTDDELAMFIALAYEELNLQFPQEHELDQAQGF